VAAVVISERRMESQAYRLRAGDQSPWQYCLKVSLTVPGRWLGGRIGFDQTRRGYHVQGFMERGLIPFNPDCENQPPMMVSQLIRRDRRKEVTGIATWSRQAGTPEAGGVERLRPRVNGQRSSGGERGETD